MKLPVRRRSRPRGPAQLAPVGDIPDSSEADQATAPAPWDGTTGEDATGAARTAGDVYRQPGPPSQAYPHGYISGIGAETTWHPAPGYEERRGMPPALPPPAPQTDPANGTTAPLSAPRYTPGYVIPPGVIAVKQHGRDTQPLARLRSQRVDDIAELALQRGIARQGGQDTRPPAPPEPEPEPAQVLGPVEITEPAVIGDWLRLPVIWCEMPRCISWYHDIGSLGERDARDRALAHGWRPDAFGRIACPQCQQRDPAYRVTRPVAWHHLEVARRWHQDGQNLSGDAKDELAAEAEYGRRISRRDPALARDIAAATGRHERQAGAR